MASELRAGSLPASTIYAHIYNRISRVWNGTSFVVYGVGSYSSYVITMTELGGSGVYVGDFPAGITDAGTYEIFYYLQDGGSPVEGDRIIATGTIAWDGTTIVDDQDDIPGAMTGAEWLEYVIRAFKRTDKDTEIFDATKDCIDEMRRRLDFPEDESYTTVTDTIVSLGDYVMALESDFGKLVSVVFQESDGTSGESLEQITRAQYDREFSPFGTGASSRGRPKKFCVFNNSILIGPVPDSVSYTYKLSYYTDDRETIDTDTESVPFTQKYRETLRRGVCARLFAEIVKDDTQAAKFGGLFDNDLRYIERRDDRNRAGSIQTKYQGF